MINQKGNSPPPTPTELFGPRKFVEGSALKHYLAIQDPERKFLLKTVTTLEEVMLSLMGIISKEKLYDPSNTSIIMCDVALEMALNMKALHQSELRELVCRQLISTSSAADPTLSLSSSSSSSGPVSISQTKKRPHTTVVNHSAILSYDQKFELRPQFHAVLSTMPEFDKHRHIFEYGELTKHLSRYIIRNKNRLFDKRNIKVCLVHGDLLGEAFGVRAFHRCQVSRLLRAQLIEAPLEPVSLWSKRIRLDN